MGRNRRVQGSKQLSFLTRSGVPVGQLIWLAETFQFWGGAQKFLRQFRERFAQLNLDRARGFLQPSNGASMDRG